MNHSRTGWSKVPEYAPDRNEWLTIFTEKYRLPQGFDVNELPPLQWKNGETALTVHVLRVIDERSKDRNKVNDKIQDELLEYVDPASMNQLIVVLLDRLGREYFASKPWIFLAISRWGDDDAIRILGEFARHWHVSNKNLRTSQSIKAFGECHRSDQALRELEYFISNAKTALTRNKAMQSLLSIAEARNVSLRELRDQVVSTHGFDPSGVKIIDLGRQKLVATILPNMTIELRNEKDKVIRSIPKGGKDDDPTKRAEAADWLANSRKELKRFATEQASRLEEMMIAGFEWTVPLWRSRFLDRPLLGILAQRILWTARNPTTNTSRTFRVAEDFTFADENDDELQFEDTEIITISHPMNWTGEEQATWKRIAIDYDLSPLFPQWDRETHLPTDEEKRGNEITRFYGRTVDHRQLRSRLARSGWQMGHIKESGATSIFHLRSFLPSEKDLLNNVESTVRGITVGKDPMDNLIINALCFHDPISIAPNYTEAIDVSLAHLIFARGSDYKDLYTWQLNELVSGNDRLSIAEVPPRMFSEVMRDIEMLTRGATLSED